MLLAVSAEDTSELSIQPSLDRGLHTHTVRRVISNGIFRGIEGCILTPGKSMALFGIW
jgi:hypothetical protein